MTRRRLEGMHINPALCQGRPGILGEEVEGAADAAVILGEAQAFGLCSTIVQPVAAGAQAALQALPRSGLLNAVDDAAARARRLRLAAVD